ncbi:MAG: hypothetical protein ACRBCJ_07555 [Hyphomicrobiaceae bacterium]
MTNYFSTILVATAMLMATAGAASAERIDRWDAQSFNGGAFATDCRDCEEDRGISIDCRVGKRMAEISIPGVSTEHGRKGRRTHVTLQVAGWKRVYRARMDYQGLIGYLPEFRISIDSPLFQRLSVGDTVLVKYQGQTSKFSLRGSARALKRFQRACRSGYAAR